MVETCEDKRHLSLHHDHYWSLLTLIKFMMDLPAQNPVPVKCCRVNWKPPDVTSLRTALKQSPATRLFGGHGKVWVHGWILWASLGSARGPIWRSGCGLWSASTTSRSWKSKKSTVRCCPCHWAIGPLGRGWRLWRSVEIWIAGIANPLAFWCVLCLVQFQSFRSDFQPSKYESPFIVSLFALIFSLLSQLSKEPWFWYYLILYVLALVRVWGTGKPKLIERFKC